jgi:hypothetical protein
MKWYIVLILMAFGISAYAMDQDLEELSKEIRKVAEQGEVDLKALLEEAAAKKREAQEYHHQANLSESKADLSAGLAQAGQHLSKNFITENESVLNSICATYLLEVKKQRTQKDMCLCQAQQLEAEAAALQELLTQINSIPALLTTNQSKAFRLLFSLSLVSLSPNRTRITTSSPAASGN